EAITPLTGSTMISSTDWMASLWVGMGISRTTSSRPGTLWVRRPSMPMRSHRPLAKTWPPSDSMNWYFRVELPALMIRIFMGLLLLVLLLSLNCHFLFPHCDLQFQRGAIKIVTTYIVDYFCRFDNPFFQSFFEKIPVAAGAFMERRRALGGGRHHRGIQPLPPGPPLADPDPAAAAGGGRRRGGGDERELRPAGGLRCFGEAGPGGVCPAGGRGPGAGAALPLVRRHGGAIRPGWRGPAGRHRRGDPPGLRL